MAYSNWGAKVWCDGEPLHDHCDATPRQILGKDVHYEHYLEHYIKEHGRDPLAQMYHAVMGGAQSGILVTIYKSCRPNFYVFVNGEWAAADFELAENFEWYESDGFTATINDVEVEAHPSTGPESSHCSFTDKLGREWRAVSGYGIGEGYQGWG